MVRYIPLTSDRIEEQADETADCAEDIAPDTPLANDSNAPTPDAIAPGNVIMEATSMMIDPIAACMPPTDDAAAPPNAESDGAAAASDGAAAALAP
ncbi:MAG: hypothetical protein IJ087_03080, partial [Eggerthellaceae bacterium]|nr:hypothetical protein [Eggerthellaceae bacterium]